MPTATPADRVFPMHGARTAYVVEALFIFAAVACGYFLLLSQIPVDDVPRYVSELGSDAFHWDLGHVWMEPLALLIQRSVLHGLTVMRALETINLVSVALGAAIFYDTLRRLHHRPLAAAMATAFVVLSYNMIVLGPTGHIKLMVFPVMAWSIRCSVFWERDAARGLLRARRAFASGLALGVSCNLLVSVLPAAPFIAGFMAWRSRQAGRRGATAWSSPLAFLVGLGIGGGVLLLAAYATARASATTPAGDLMTFVFGGIKEKEDLHVGFASIREVPFRFAFGVVYNFAFLPTLGALGRARIGGLAIGDGAVLGALAWQAVLALISVASLLAIVGVAVRSWSQRHRPLLLALGYVCGAAVFSLYYNLNDPEHWFQFTMPIALIAIEARRVWLSRLVFGLWFVCFAVANLGLYAIPKARFDLQERSLAMRAVLAPAGLYVGYAGYPGEPDSSLIGGGEAVRFKLDLELDQAAGNVPATLAKLDAAIDAALARGGRVIVFRALEPDDWRGPVFVVSTAGLTKERLAAHLAGRYHVSGPIEVAGFAAREVTRGGA